MKIFDFHGGENFFGFSPAGRHFFIEETEGFFKTCCPAPAKQYVKELGL
jgi:hypothetical protein